MKLIVGLGNPGEQYKLTRHNIGFIFIDEYLKENNINDVREKFKSLFVQTTYNGDKVFYQKPTTFMNLSGEAIGEAVRFFKIDPKTELFVIYDDMDLEVGRIRIREKGSAGGHNGIKSIISHCGDKFTRIKIGIGAKKENAISHVLGNFSKQEEEILDSRKDDIVNLVKDVLNGMSTEKLMNKYNTK